MGGFLVPVQPFGVYQALDWLVRDDTSVDNVIRALERIRSVIEKGRADEIIKLNIVSRLIECLETTQCKRLQVPRNIEAYPSIEIILSLFFQADIIWTLANIAAGKSAQTKLVLRKGLNKFIEMLEADNDDGFVVDIVWILSNIAGDDSCRDDLVDARVIPIIMKFLETSSHLELQKKCIWFFSNIVRHSNPIEFIKVSPFIPILARYLKHSDTEIIFNICWTFKYLTDGDNEERNLVIASGICQRIVDLIRQV